MTGKRFENRLNKSDIKFNTLNPVWDNERGTALNVFEMIEEMNKLEDENKQLGLQYSELEITLMNNQLAYNDLNDENKELRIQYNHIREQSNEFHRIARENANRVGQLEKENKQLKSINQDHKDHLADFYADYDRLEKENEQLKQELQKIYEIATINKVRDIVENVYDDLLYETSDESDYARTKVLKCLEDIDNLRDDLE